MAPRFRIQSFQFEEGEKIPEHDEDWAGNGKRDHELWHVDGFDPNDSEYYPLASDLVSPEDAELLATAALRKIMQPHLSFSRTTVEILHDSVHIIGPSVEKAA